jgi:hypothetical protein
MRKLSLFLTPCLLVGCLAAAAPAAQAQIGVQGFGAAVCQGDYNITSVITTPDDPASSNCVGAPGSYYTQSGGHPFTGVTDFIVANNGTAPDANVSSIRVDLPAGLISNPQATPQCTDSQFPSCPSNTQLGVVRLVLFTLGMDEDFGASVYNMVPPAGKVSDFAFNIPVANVRTDITGGVRSTSDDGLFFTIAVPSSTPSAELVRSTLIFWGDPGAAAHSPDIGWSCDPTSLTTCMPPASGPSTSLAGTPFISLPSGCVPAGQVTTLTLSDGTNQAQSTSSTPVPATGCQNVPFQPSLTATPSTTQHDSPTGLSVDLNVDRSGDTDPAGLQASMLKDAVVTLPPGMTLDPSAANGLSACSPAQLGQGSDAAPTCPDSSQIGTVEIDTPVLANPLRGTIYLGCDGAAPTACPASTGLSYLYVYATDPVSGVAQKLVGTVTADATTGRLTTTFANQPQVPFSDFKLNFNSGAHAPIANPLACGSSTVTSSLTPYSGNAAAGPTSTFTIDADGKGGACPSTLPFAPGLAASEATTQTGEFDSPFTVTISRTDGQQYLQRIAVALPPGLLGAIANVPLCPEPAATHGTCGATSAIGKVAVLAGPGTDPVNQAGTVYLTGPYDGAPFGMSIVVPAIAGPFSLGTVVVRAGLAIDRNDAHVTVISDPLPQVVGGIPLRYKSIAITINRPQFLFNPTSCSPLSILSTITSATGAGAMPSTPFQASGCSSLPFSPALQVAFAGTKETGAGGHPSLVANVTSTSGQANIRSASVTLPPSLQVDLAAAQGRVCSPEASQSDSCPANTIVGSATIVTPLLTQPLTGPVYLVEGAGGSPFPSLLVNARGQVALDLRSQTSIGTGGGLDTTFSAIPDAPVTSFQLQLNGGKQGILVVAPGMSLCRGAQGVTASFLGQNGATKNLVVNASTPCGPQARLLGIRAVRHTLRVRLRVPAAGNVTVSAPGMKSVRRHVGGARTLTLTLKLTRAATARLHKYRKLKLQALIRYTPAGYPTQALRSRKVAIRR